MFYIAVCDDEEYYGEQLYDLLVRYQKENDFLAQIKIYASGKELLHDLPNLDTSGQILFLDVDMPEQSGVDVAKVLREVGSKAVICFVTSYEQYAFDAFQVEALDYIVKPASYEKVEKFMHKAIDWCQMQEERVEAEKEYLTLYQKPENRVIRQNEVCYIEKKRNQCVVFTAHEEITCYDTLQNLYEQLDHSKFVYAHQGYIVNFYQIKEIRDNTAFLGKKRNPN